MGRFEDSAKGLDMLPIIPRSKSCILFVHWIICGEGRAESPVESPVYIRNDALNSQISNLPSSKDDIEGNPIDMGIELPFDDAARLDVS